VHFFYTLAILVLAVVLSPWFAYQAVRYRKYIGSLTQRMGYLPVTFNLDGDESIWIHAVSVGEALTARALIAELREKYPGLKLFLSTTTLTGQNIGRSLQGVDAVFFFPFDLPPFVNRTLRLVKPRLFIMMETEIWPNLLRACRRQGVKTMLVNGRISARSYPRYRMARSFFRPVLGDVDRFCMQSDESARRIVDIGADPARVTVTGSLKFDSMDSPAAVAAGRGAGRVLRFFRVPSGRLVFMAASTLKGEEAPVLAAFAAVRRVHQNALLVMAPRKPERFGDAEALARAEGYRVLKRSELGIDAEPRADVVILDTMGELAQLFQIATVVFVGGSLVDAGGHNILEPAVHGKPIVFGPHMQNFTEIAEAFLRNQAAIQVADAGALTKAIVRLCGDSVERARLGAAARALVEANRGAKPRTLDAIAALVPPPSGRGGVLPFRVV
jgi:3-deoxy-D-manno-octulosonic-acid transferase